MAAPKRRLRQGLLARFAVRVRRIFRVVEAGRLGIFVPRRGGIDAGQAGGDGVQHPRRMPIQWGHPHSASGGRSDELAAHPGDELVPGVDVHHALLCAEARATRDRAFSAM